MAQYVQCTGDVLMHQIGVQLDKGLLLTAQTSKKAVLVNHYRFNK